jgi:hypothetical protein
VTRAAPPSALPRPSRRNSIPPLITGGYQRRYWTLANGRLDDRFVFSHGEIDKRKDLYIRRFGCVCGRAIRATEGPCN